jgi:hypothetical protein
MNTKEMRAALKGIVPVVPRSNMNMKALYLEKFPPPKAPIMEIVPRESFTYTYVGDGEDPCSSVKFMDIQHFTRGMPTEVDDPLVLSKIRNHKSFVEGEADPEEMRRNVERAEARADKQRAKDRVTQAWAERNRA